MTELNNSAVFDLDAYLDVSLDSIPDLPDFVNPPSGTHKLLMSAPKIDAAKGTISINGKYLEALELVKEGEVAPKEGSIVGETYRGSDTDPAIGISRCKKVFAPLMEAKGWNTLRELLDNLEGMELAITTKQRGYTDKNGDPAISSNFVVAGEV